MIKIKNLNTDFVTLQNINCYLIDNNGFILVSEDYTQTGNFFGEVEGAVMNKLLIMGSFKR
ncbi:Voltage-dependent calcium channel subunit alpha-2/delta-3 [Varanus komodoensis]|nr:Voltage-dependent calcium channel subunit alpha-2/delta-3 [Varanus komodoensis]